MSRGPWTSYHTTTSRQAGFSAGERAIQAGRLQPSTRALFSPIPLDALPAADYARHEAARYLARFTKRRPLPLAEWRERREVFVKGFLAAALVVPFLTREPTPIATAPSFGRQG